MGGHHASLAPSGGVVENGAVGLTPSAENAAEIAAMAVPVVEENYGVMLDYGVASLAQLDTIIDDLRRDQRFEALQPLLFSLGCYVGEVLVRHAGGRWRTHRGARHGEGGELPGRDRDAGRPRLQSGGPGVQAVPEGARGEPRRVLPGDDGAPTRTGA